MSKRHPGRKPRGSRPNCMCNPSKPGGATLGGLTVAGVATGLAVGGALTWIFLGSSIKAAVAGRLPASNTPPVEAPPPPVVSGGGGNSPITTLPPGIERANQPAPSMIIDPTLLHNPTDPTLRPAAGIASPYAVAGLFSVSR